MNFFGSLLNQTASDANRVAQERFEREKRVFIDYTKELIDKKMSSDEVKQKIKKSAQTGNYKLVVHNEDNSIDDSFYVASTYNGKDITKEEYNKAFQDQQKRHYTCDAWREYIKEANRKGHLPTRLVYEEVINRYSMVDTYHVKCNAFFIWDTINELKFKKDKMIGKILGS